MSDRTMVFTDGGSTNHFAFIISADAATTDLFCFLSQESRRRRASDPHKGREVKGMAEAPKDIETLLERQEKARSLADMAWEMLFVRCEGPPAGPLPQPNSKLRQMILYEQETIDILQDVVETLRQLKKGGE